MKHRRPDTAQARAALIDALTDALLSAHRARPRPAANLLDSRARESVSALTPLAHPASHPTHGGER